MTEDKIADWHAQFAPAAAATVDGKALPAERQGTVEHFANEDGVFTAPAPAAVEPAAPVADAPAAKSTAKKDSAA